MAHAWNAYTHMHVWNFPRIDVAMHVCVSVPHMHKACTINDVAEIHAHYNDNSIYNLYDDLNNDCNQIQAKIRLAERTYNLLQSPNNRVVERPDVNRLINTHDPQGGPPNSKPPCTRRNTCLTILQRPHLSQKCSHTCGYIWMGINIIILHVCTHEIIIWWNNSKSYF